MDAGKISQTNKKNGTGRNWTELLFFPPIALLPVLLLAMLLGDAYERESVSTPILTAMVLGYGGLSLAYLTLRKKALPKAALAAALLADGLLFIFVSVTMGTGGAWGWMGLALFLAGLFSALAQLSPPPAARFAKTTPDLLPSNVTKSDIRRLLSAIPFPTAFLEADDDGTERVAAANEPLAAILGKNADKMTGGEFASMLPPHAEGATFRYADAEWVPHRTMRGKQALFMLSPMVKIEEADALPSAGDIVDPETNLFTPHYMKYKAHADVQACKRYQRKLAVVLLKLSFEGGVVVPSEEAQRTAFQAFAQMVSVSVRACDTAYRIKDSEIVVFMPEASQTGANSLVNRMNENMRKLATVECVDLAAATLVDTVANFIGEETSSVDQVMKELYVIAGRRGG